MYNMDESKDVIQSGISHTTKNTYIVHGEAGVGNQWGRVDTIGVCIWE